MHDPILSPMARLRNYFLTGLVVCAPLAITAYLAWSFIGWVDGWVKPYVPVRYNPDHYLPFAVPGFGLLVALIMITLIGFLTANFIGKAIVSYGERLLNRLPMVRGIYKALKQIFEIDHKNNDAHAFDVLQERQAEAVSFRRTFENAGNIGDDHRAPDQVFHHADIGRERGKRIIRNFRVGLG